MLAQVSLARIAEVYNHGVHVLPVGDFTSVKKFASKDAGIARIEKFIAASEGRVDLLVDSVDGQVVFNWVAVEDEDSSKVPESNPHAASNALISAAVAAGDLDLPEVTEVEGESVEEPATDAPFVKLSKAELDALGERGSPAREAYRRARRAAARQARKAKGE